jgi:hypothetical protein
MAYYREHVFVDASALPTASVTPTIDPSAIIAAG